MNISAHVASSLNSHEIVVTTNDAEKTITIPPKSSGFGSSVNGGELLLLALATCYCNDLYREAARQNITLHSVNVTVHAVFGREGEPGNNFTYTADVKGDAPPAVIEALLKHTDSVAEIQRTLRKGADITLVWKQ